METSHVVIAVAVTVLAIVAIVFAVKREHYEDIGKGDIRNKDTRNEDVRKCVCTSNEGGRGCGCQYKNATLKAYDDGVMTEYTDLKSKGWSRVSPGDLNFPSSTGCGWSGRDLKSDTPHAWQSWDYTDFAS